AFDILPRELEKYPEPDSLAAKINGEWRTYSTQDVINKANQVSLGLLKLGIKNGDKVAIVSMNRPEWVFVDYGIQQIGAVGVPMYPTITEEDYRYIFNDAEVKAVFVSDRTLYNKVVAATANIPGIKEIYTFDDVPGAKCWTDLLDLAKGEDAAILEPLKAAISPDDLLTIIYTSGTTGNPKGVMLSHNNIVSNVKGASPYVPVNNHHRALSFLPLCHIYERMLLYLYMSFGVSIY